jgi:hypothetical protein
MAGKDYGTILKKGSTVVGEIISTGIPEIKAGKADTTNMSSGGWVTFIPTGMKELGEFEVGMLVSGSAVGNVYADMLAETVSLYTVAFASVITGSSGSWTFSAFPTSIKVEDAKADKAGVLQVKVKFQASGSLVVA